MLTWQQLEQFVKNFIRPLKGRRREQSAFAIAAACFSAGYFVGGKWIPEWPQGKDWRSLATVQLALYLLGAIAFIYAAYRIWRLTHATDLPPVKDRPLVIKGPSAFTPGDGELFRRLGRESELQELMGYVLDNQVRLVVLMGESGAGKTSLLRAGLPHILKDKSVRVHYWEAVPTDSAERLLRAIQEDWSTNGATKPAKLEDLIDPSAESLGAEAHVIVLDQFEQLNESNPVCQFLRRIANEAPQPSSLTWVIAFRLEFRPQWSELFTIPEQSKPREERVYPPEMSLRLFTRQKAVDVISHLMKEADLSDSIEQAVVNNLIEAATNKEGRVSPVEIGIGLLALSELHERQEGRILTLKDYRFAAGAEGLLTQYINRSLERFAETEREPLLKSLLALRDPDTLQRRAEGLPLDGLAAEAETDPTRLQPNLDFLARREIRLLETVMKDSVTHYRLPHERLIPALHRLTGKLLGEIEQARLRFENAFLAWQKNDKRRHYLLKGKDLKLIERNASQMPWGSAGQEKQNYLRQSLRRRSFVQMGAVAAAIALMFVSWGGSVMYQQNEHKRYLRESGYPPELYVWQHQLKKLELTESLDLERLTGLSSNSIEELTLKAENSSNSITGLASLSKCHSLKKLTLGLSSSEVSNLEPLSKLSNLTQLMLDLRNSRVENLNGLAQSRHLKQLTLYLDENKEIGDLEPLAKLSLLTHLTLDRSSRDGRMAFILTNQGCNLEPISRLNNLKQLVLDLHFTRKSDLEPLSRLSNLTQLTLDLSHSQVSNLESLAKLSNLAQLTLDLRDSEVGNLNALSKLSNLTHLTLRLHWSQVNNLELPKLSSRTQLSLDLGGSQLSNLELPAELGNLTQLTLDLHNHAVGNLEPLLKLSHLIQLTLSIGDNQVGKLEPLAQLSNSTQLILFIEASLSRNLDGSLSKDQIYSLDLLAELGSLTQLTLDLKLSKRINLELLSKLSNLTQLTLDARVSYKEDYESLSKLNNLTQLTFDLSKSVGRHLQPLAKLNNLTQLTLNLHSSQESDLEPLSGLNRLTQLSLDIGESRVRRLEPLSKLTHLQALSIKNATRAQRMSLQKLPASVVELSF